MTKARHFVLLAAILPACTSGSPPSSPPPMQVFAVSEVTAFNCSEDDPRPGGRKFGLFTCDYRITITARHPVHPTVGPAPLTVIARSETESPLTEGHALHIRLPSGARGPLDLSEQERRTVGAAH